ncbi:hypothetical protein Syun_027591 [Stephania yunnanensis]|uniref:Uncharacterized protein n=1 Tax=Stephania yunnanensis TaxID=152371 RepID=A0AAP0EFV8_9MAGN
MDSNEFSEWRSPLKAMAGRVFIVHNPPETYPVQAGLIVAEGAQVQVELILRTSDKLPEDTLSTSTDTGVRATTEERQAREFERHYPEKFHVRRIDSHLKIHDVLAISAQMQSSISSAPLVSEVDVW